MKRIDALMRSVYGRTFYQFVTDQIQRAWQGGYKEGIKAGKRLAKGKPEFPVTEFLKSRGRPKVLGHELLRQQFINFVNRMREEGVSLPAAVSKYRQVFGRAWKVLEEPPELRQEQLLRLYKRATKLKQRQRAPREAGFIKHFKRLGNKKSGALFL
jgi:hypothetical protein